MADLHVSQQLLLVSTNHALEERTASLLRGEGLPPLMTANGIEQAKRILIETDVDIVLLDVPLPKEDAASFAIELVRSGTMSFGVILLIKAGSLEDKIYQAQRLGIITLTKPLETQLLLQTIHLLRLFQARIRKLESEADRLQKKLEDDRVVSRAKLLLIERKKLSEEDAHRYIERKAMDCCVKKTQIAKEIIHKFEQRKQ